MREKIKHAFNLMHLFGGYKYFIFTIFYISRPSNYSQRPLFVRTFRHG